MNCKFHVHHVFDKMLVLVGRGQVKSQFKFWFISFVSMSFFISGSFNEFWAEA